MTVSTQPYALVVDDDALIRMEACFILQDAGFRTHEAVDGDDARRMLDLKGQTIVLLFTDVQMPGRTDGYALARYASSAWPEIEIVVASGALTPGPDDLPAKATFIPKPFDVQIVHDHLKTALPDGKKPAPLKSAV